MCETWASVEGPLLFRATECQAHVMGSGGVVHPVIWYLGTYMCIDVAPAVREPLQQAFTCCCLGSASRALQCAT